MMGINTLLASIMPSYFVHFGVCSTITGILNASAYVGCAISSYTNGSFVENFGWDTTMTKWCELALIGALVCIPAIRRWGKFRELANSRSIDNNP